MTWLELLKEIQDKISDEGLNKDVYLYNTDMDTIHFPIDIERDNDGDFVLQF